MAAPVVQLPDQCIIDYSYRWTLGSQLGMVTMQARVSLATGIPFMALSDVLSMLSTNAAGAARAVATNLATYAGVTGNRIGPVIRSIQVSVTNGTGIGTAGAGMMPAQVSGLVQKLTTTAGRSHRGRSYIPFPSNDDLDPTNGRCTNGYGARVNTFVGIIYASQTLTLGGVLQGSVTPVILHRGLPVSIATSQDIAGSTIYQAWATQRSRGRFGRPNV